LECEGDRAGVSSSQKSCWRGLVKHFRAILVSLWGHRGKSGLPGGVASTASCIPDWASLYPFAAVTHSSTAAEQTTRQWRPFPKHQGLKRMCCCDCWCSLCTNQQFVIVRLPTSTFADCPQHICQRQIYWYRKSWSQGVGNVLGFEAWDCR